MWDSGKYVSGGPSRGNAYRKEIRERSRERKKERGIRGKEKRTNLNTKWSGKFVVRGEIRPSPNETEEQDQLRRRERLRKLEKEYQFRYYEIIRSTATYLDDVPEHDDGRVRR